MTDQEQPFDDREAPVDKVPQEQEEPVPGKEAQPRSGMLLRGGRARAPHKSTFAARMAEAGYSAGRRYDAVKNAFLRYVPSQKGAKKLRSRIGATGETFSAGKTMLARLTVVGGYLRLFLALDPKAYNEQKYHHKDVSEVVRYAKTPFMIKLSSDRQVRYAAELISELMAANGFVADEGYVPRDHAGVFKPSRGLRTKIPYAAASEAAPALPACESEGEEREEPRQDDLSDAGEPEAIDVRLPRRAAVSDKKGQRAGTIRRSIWYGEEGEVRGEFRKEDTNVFLYANEARRAYVDKNNNILTLDNAYVATIRRFALLPVLIIVIILAAATVLSAVLSAYFLTRSQNSNYAPVLFIADGEGTRWKDDENLAMFVNEHFGDAVVAPGVEGVYRFTLRNNNQDPLVFSLTFSEENEYGIALSYKLRRDGTYVSDKENHVRTHELGVEGMTLEAHSATMFELEWRWEDNDEADTLAGMNSARYTLNITFTAYVQGSWA